MIRRPPRSTRTDTLFPDTTLFRSRHPRLGIDLEQENAGEAMFVVPAKIGPRGALAAEQAVRFDREILHPLRDVIRHLGGADMLGQPLDRKSTRLNSSH